MTDFSLTDRTFAIIRYFRIASFEQRRNVIETDKLAPRAAAIFSVPSLIVAIISLNRLGIHLSLINELSDSIIQQ